MGEPPPGSPAEEAERLVVSALAAVSLATRGWLAGRADGHRVATGADECCACPLCRALTVAADPSPELVERLATAAAEVATGVTALLRALGDAIGHPASTDPAPTGTDPAQTAPTDPAEAEQAGTDAGATGRAATDQDPADQEATDPQGEQTDIPPQSAGRGGKTMRTPVHQVVPAADPIAPASVDNGDAAS